VTAQLAAAGGSAAGGRLARMAPRIEDQLELGYVSPFLLSNVDTTRQYAPLLQLHTRGSYRVSAYHIAPSWTGVHPRLRQVINASVDALHDLSRLKEGDIAARLRHEGLHIALDNGGGHLLPPPSYTHIHSCASLDLDRSAHRALVGRALR